MNRSLAILLWTLALVTWAVPIALGLAGAISWPDVVPVWLRVVLLMLFASFGPVIGSYITYHATRSNLVPEIGRVDVDRLVEARTRFALYLRDFRPERATLSSPARSSHEWSESDLQPRTPRFVAMPENQSEASIYSSLRHLLPIVALSNQGSNSNVSIPALRAEFTKWELEFQRLAPAAFLVVIVATRLGPGLEIELAWLKNHRAGGPLWLVASPDALQHIRCHYRELLESELTWTTLLGDGSLAARLQRVSLPDALKIYLEKALTGTSITKR